MSKMKKLVFGLLTLLAVSALTVGFVACDNGEKDDKDENGGNETQVVVEGGYAYYPPDQGGYGLELNLYDDGTFYYSQFTSKISSGTYTSAAATGTTSDGNTVLFTVTFGEGDSFGDGVHQIVQDSEGAVYLTNMYDDMSLGTYSFTKQDDYIEEVVRTVAQFWSNDYEVDFITAAFYSDDTYTLDGINGAGQAGSMGTYTVAEAEGVTTYTMTDEADSSKTYTITVGADSSITLKVGETEYPMTSTNPTATVTATFTGTNSWGASVSLICYSDTTCKVQITLEGVMDFADATGTWSYMSTEDMYIFVLGGTSFSAEKGENGAYSFEYTIAAAQFGGEKVTLSYTPAEATE